MSPLQESFREKYNLAQYAGGPLSVQKSVAGVNAQVSKNLPVPTLPHNLAARTKLLAFTKRGSSVAGHYDRVGSGGAYDDAASKTDSGLLIKTNNNHQRFLLDTSMFSYSLSQLQLYVVSYQLKVPFDSQIIGANRVRLIVDEVLNFVLKKYFN